MLSFLFILWLFEWIITSIIVKGKSVIKLTYGRCFCVWTQHLKPYEQCFSMSSDNVKNSHLTLKKNLLQMSLHLFEVFSAVLVWNTGTQFQTLNPFFGIPDNPPTENMAMKTEFFKWTENSNLEISVQNQTVIKTTDANAVKGSGETKLTMAYNQLWEKPTNSWNKRIFTISVIRDERKCQSMALLAAHILVLRRWTQFTIPWHWPVQTFKHSIMTIYETVCLLIKLFK